MSKRKSVTKLFAVVALGLAGCEEATPAPAAAEPAPRVTPQPSVAKPQAMAPRTLPDGKPACGNVMGKAPAPKECEMTAADFTKFCFVQETRTCVPGTDADKRSFATWKSLMAAKPRTLETGAPAPGNVASRAAVKR
jgi:hypothetical protein